MTTTFLSGSRRISRPNAQVKTHLFELIQKKRNIIIGDANGADKAMQRFLAQEKYLNVRVFYAGEVCRNNIGKWPGKQIDVDTKLKGRAMYTKKDKAMAELADEGVVLWDGKSAGSILNICEMLSHQKPTRVYRSNLEVPHDVKTREDLKNLFSECDAVDIAALEASPLLKIKLEALNLASQLRLNL